MKLKSIEFVCPEYDMKIVESMNIDGRDVEIVFCNFNKEKLPTVPPGNEFIDRGIYIGYVELSREEFDKNDSIQYRQIGFNNDFSMLTREYENGKCYVSIQCSDFFNPNSDTGYDKYSKDFCIQKCRELVGILGSLKE
jgi:hypothetical protein